MGMLSRYTEALKYYDKALKIESGNTRIQIDKSRLLEELGKSKDI